MITQQIESLTLAWYEKHHKSPNVLRMSTKVYQDFNAEAQAKLREIVLSGYFAEPLDEIRQRRELWDALEKGISGYQSNFGFLRIVVIETEDEVLEVSREIGTKEALKAIAQAR